MAFPTDQYAGTSPVFTDQTALAYKPLPPLTLITAVHKKERKDKESQGKSNRDSSTFYMVIPLKA